MPRALLPLTSRKIYVVLCKVSRVHVRSTFTRDIAPLVVRHPVYCVCTKKRRETDLRYMSRGQSACRFGCTSAQDCRWSRCALPSASSKFDVARENEKRSRKLIYTGGKYSRRGRQRVICRREALFFSDDFVTRRYFPFSFSLATQLHYS